MARNWYGCADVAGTPDVDEQAFAALLASTFGDTVTWFAASDPVPGDLSPYHGVIFGTSMPANQDDKWDSIDIPVISMHMGRFIHSQMASVTSASAATARDYRGIDATAARVTHPIGSVTMHTVVPATGYVWIQDTNLAPNAVILGRHQDAGTRITGILIPGGTTLLNAAVSPPSHRASLPVNEYTTLTADAELVIEEIVTWVAPPPLALPVVNVATSTAEQLDASGSTVTGTPVYGFEQLSGPAVVLAGTGAVRTFTRPDPLTESIVITVTITDDNGSTASNVTFPADGTGSGTDVHHIFNGTEWVLVTA